MITVKDKVFITKNQHIITIDVGLSVPEGEYDVEMIFKEKKKRSMGILDFPVSNFNIETNLLFSRHEIYGEDGR